MRAIEMLGFSSVGLDTGCVALGIGIIGLADISTDGLPTCVSFWVVLESRKVVRAPSHDTKARNCNCKPRNRNTLPISFVVHCMVCKKVLEINLYPSIIGIPTQPDFQEPNF